MLELEMMLELVLRCGGESRRSWLVAGRGPETGSMSDMTILQQ